MENLFLEHGYPALFLFSFLASTIIPLGSEWLLVALIVKGSDPVTAISVATVGNTLGACTTYLVGLYGGDFLVRKVLRTDEESQKRAEQLYARYGFWSLLLSWLPIVGDPLCLVGGVLKVRFELFAGLVFAGKLARYVAVGIVTMKLVAA